MFITPVQCHGQQGLRLIGKIVSSDGNIVNYAALKLSKATDSAFVGQTVAKDGVFSFARVGKGGYLLTIVSEGFDLQLFNLNVDVDKDVLITLVPTVKALRRSPLTVRFRYSLMKMETAR